MICPKININRTTERTKNAERENRPGDTYRRLVLSIKTPSVEDHVRNAVRIGGGTLVDPKRLPSYCIVLVVARKNHLVSLDPDIAFAPPAIPDIAKAISILKNLQGIPVVIPYTAEDFILR